MKSINSINSITASTCKTKCAYSTSPIRTEKLLLANFQKYTKATITMALRWEDIPKETSDRSRVLHKCWVSDTSQESVTVTITVVIYDAFPTK